MMQENFWVGNTEYIIRYRNGTHELLEIEQVNYDEYKTEIIATGTYEHCRKIVEEARIEYLESLF